MPLTLNGNGQISGFTDTYAWTQTHNYPLTSLTDVTQTGGTWTVNTYAQVTAGSGGFGALVGPSISQTAAAHIVEFEWERPASLAATAHIKAGWGVGSTTNYTTGGVRGDNNWYLEAENTSALGNGSWTLPAVGSWIKVRFRWVPAQSLFQLYLDGVFVAATTRTQSVAPGMQPRISFNFQGTNTVRFRNLKAWSLTNYPAAPFPGDPA